MNKLANIDVARPLVRDAASFRLFAGTLPRPRGRLICVWAKDPPSGRLVCSWIEPKDSDQGRARAREEPALGVAA